MRFKIIIAFFFIFVFGCNTVFGQNPKFDKLEMLFDQGHYKKVYRKSKRLLDNPEYDFSELPKYYKSLSLFQLSQNEYWLSRNDKALIEAKTLFEEVRDAEYGKDLFLAHMFELAWVKADLASWAEDLNRTGKKERFEEVQKIIEDLFGNVPGVESSEPIVVDSSAVELEVDFASLELRDKIIVTAKQYIGVPYVWAGNTPEGFDCSGFTGYVMKEVGVELPRISRDQYSESTKVKAKNVQKGDLVFFDNGNRVSHVGIVVSEKGKPLQMIHASSSKGIIITDVEKSDYWVQRVYGYGSYLD